MNIQISNKIRGVLWEGLGKRACEPKTTYPRRSVAQARYAAISCQHTPSIVLDMRAEDDVSPPERC